VHRRRIFGLTGPALARARQGFDWDRRIFVGALRVHVRKRRTLVDEGAVIVRDRRSIGDVPQVNA
jgi:hypothetical protein